MTSRDDIERAAQYIAGEELTIDEFREQFPDRFVQRNLRGLIRQGAFGPVHVSQLRNPTAPRFQAVVRDALGRFVKWLTS